MPELPLIYRNKYREQISMNKHLIELDSLDMLKGDAAYIFMKSKPIEELYDLESDPYEVHNLATDIAHSQKLKELRVQLKQWQTAIDDKGFTPENEIIKTFWPNMKQPKTDAVFIQTNEQNILLSCKTDGASIGYQLGEDIGSQYWQLYTAPIQIKSNEKIRARAIRIGYEASNISNN